MKRLVFSLACFLVVGCGGTKNQTEDPQMHANADGGASDDGVAPLQAIYEIREQDGGAKVGMVYKRDHGEGRSVFWVYDARGDRRGFITTDNRAYKYDYTLGKRSDKAAFIGSDTISASARKLIGHDRVVRLSPIDIETWANPGSK